MDLKYLEYIIAIADMHSISRAAESLFITQSNLSQRLINVENELGVKLFDRKKNDVSLTPAGKLYVEAARNMLLQKKELYNRIADLTGSKTGSFRLGVTPQWGADAFTCIYSEFLKEYPNITIDLKEETAQPLIHDLFDNNMDMAIIPLADSSDLLLNHITIASEELLIAIPKEQFPQKDVGKGIPTVSLQEVRHIPAILSHSDTTIRKIENRAFANAKVYPKTFCEINSHPASLRLVAQGLGLTFLPISYARKNDQLIYAHCTPRLEWQVAAAFRNGFEPRASELYLVSLMKDYLGKTASINEIE